MGVTVSVLATGARALSLRVHGISQPDPFIADRHGSARIGMTVFVLATGVRALSWRVHGSSHFVIPVLFRGEDT